MTKNEAEAQQWACEEYRKSCDDPETAKLYRLFTSENFLASQLGLFDEPEAEPCP